MTTPIRIGNGCGFWGDSLQAPITLAERGRLDYLTLEYLAELTMSILALQKQRDAGAGFATDFLDVLDRLTPTLRAQPRLKIVTNAGGMNPQACAAKARAPAAQGGLAARRGARGGGRGLDPPRGRAARRRPRAGAPGPGRAARVDPAARRQRQRLLRRPPHRRGARPWRRRGGDNGARG